jgi:hypothetical protein
MQRELLEQHARNPIFSDVTFVSGISGERIPGHRIIQASSSHYFAELFTQNPDKKVYQLPKPIQPITQPYVFNEKLIPQDLTAEQQEDEAVKEAEPAKEEPKADDNGKKVNVAKLLGFGKGKGKNDTKTDDIKSLNVRAPVTLDPTRSLLSLTYILDKKDSNQVNE